MWLHHFGIAPLQRARPAEMDTTLLRRCDACFYALLDDAPLKLRHGHEDTPALESSRRHVGIESSAGNSQSKLLFVGLRMLAEGTRMNSPRPHSIAPLS